MSCDDEIKEQDLGSGYAYLTEYGAFDFSMYSGNAITYKSQYEDPVVFPKVLEYRFNAHYILCKQLYDAEMSKLLLKESIEFKFGRRKYQKEKINYETLIFYVPEFKDGEKLFKLLSTDKNNNKLHFTNNFVDSIVSDNVNFKKMKKNKINYHIIDKKNNQTHLVLNKDEFEQLFKKLKLPDSLRLN
jgi:hypothetical protein